MNSEKDLLDKLTKDLYEVFLKEDTILMVELLDYKRDSADKPIDIKLGVAYSREYSLINKLPLVVSISSIIEDDVDIVNYTSEGTLIYKRPVFLKKDTL